MDTRRQALADGAMTAVMWLAALSVGGRLISTARWRATIKRPDSGPMDVRTRAIDGTGSRQTRRESDPHPGGSTGWHGLDVSI
jgi:hypothetical protein